MRFGGGGVVPQRHKQSPIFTVLSVTVRSIACRTKILCLSFPFNSTCFSVYRSRVLFLYFPVTVSLLLLFVSFVGLLIIDYCFWRVQ